MRRRAVVAACALVVALGGCGGGDDVHATLTATGTRTPAALSWAWTLTNNESEPIVVLDGPVDGTTGQPQLWITPDDDTVEVAYRFLAPPDGVDVARPILQAGHTVAPGATLSGQARANRPLEVRHPYAGAFDPPLALPSGDPKVRFCVGVVRADEVPAQPGGSYAHTASAETAQYLVCAR